MTSTDRLEDNLAVIQSAYVRAAGERSQLVVLPENSLFFRIQSGAKLQGPLLAGPELSALQEAVEQHQTAMMITAAIQQPSGKFLNSTVCFRPGVEPLAAYSKIHLFDVDVAGAPPIRESDHFLAGEKPSTLEIAGWKFGLTICYDLRFPELFLKYAQAVDCILVPSAFLVPTGEAHWEVLLRARAIESQAYVIAPAQAGSHASVQDQSAVRKTYGHALAVDPWGRVLADLGNAAAADGRVDVFRIQTLELSKDQILKVRRQIPMASHRRL